jgi:CBS-domain-containing membrane protein
VVVCGTVAIGSLGALAAATGSALVFPSLGAVAYLVFAHPHTRAARPRESVLGLLLGLGLGYASALAFGLERGEELHADWAHVGASSLALALTTLALLGARVDHPPACSTALLVALGVWTPWQIGVLAAGGVALVALAFAINRAWGIPYPAWAQPPARSAGPRVASRGREPPGDVGEPRPPG